MTTYYWVKGISDDPDLVAKYPNRGDRVVAGVNVATDGGPEDAVDIAEDLFEEAEFDNVDYMQPVKLSGERPIQGARANLEKPWRVG